MFDISLPSTVTGDLAQVGAAATENLVKLAREWRGPTYLLLTIIAGWVGVKAFVAVHQELSGTAPVKHDVAHRTLSSA